MPSHPPKAPRTGTVDVPRMPPSRGSLPFAARETALQFGVPLSSQAPRLSIANAGTTRSSTPASHSSQPARVTTTIPSPRASLPIRDVGTPGRRDKPSVVAFGATDTGLMGTLAKSSLPAAGRTPIVPPARPSMTTTGRRRSTPAEELQTAAFGAPGTGTLPVVSIPVTMLPPQRDASDPAQQLRAYAYAAIRSWAQHHCGLAFASDQNGNELFEGRIDALCRDLAWTPESLLALLRSGNPDAALRVAEVLSTNYTFFRREPTMFDYLAQKVFPTLPSGPLRFWSAATSSGDEAYSIAMTAHEYFGADALTRVRILGTDLSARQVQMAEKGIYPREQAAPLDANRFQRWFTLVDRNQVKVAEPLRQLCTFRRMNLTHPSWPFNQKFHVIFLRNVLYYFDPPTRREILERCFDVAEDGAVLITSLTEPMVDVSTRWQALRPAVFRRGRR